VIDFRYHLVSIIAVFLALAIGIVIGANELQGTTEAALGKAASKVTRINTSLMQQRKALQQQVSADQDFAQASSSRLIGHLLDNQSVVLVTAPGASSQVISGITKAVQQSGAQLTGQVSMGSQFFDGADSTEAKLTQLAQSLAPGAGVTLSSQPGSSTVSGQVAAAQVIAAALVAKVGPGLTAAQSQAILGGFGQSGYLQISDPANGNATTLEPATVAIVVAPSSVPASSDSSAANQALIALAEQLEAGSHGTVLAGSLSGSGPGSAIDELSGAGKVSTVDNADTAVGQITTVQALWERLAGRSPTSYGVGPGAVPSPAPTPSVSPTSTVAQHVRKK
jgi:hypothetical protein